MQSPNFIGFYEKLAPDDYCDRMIEAHKHLMENTSRSSSYMDGSESNRGVENRLDYSFMFERERRDLAQETNNVLNNALDLYKKEYPSVAMQDFVSHAVKVQLTRPKGGFHRWHCEHAIGRGSEARNLTWTIYLNDVPEGEGETEFLEHGEKITPKKGLVCLFPAAWTHTHRGNPVYSCDKYIATGWYYLT